MRLLKQKGAALVLMLFIITMATLTYLLSALNSESLRLNRDKKTMQTLNAAKEALIGWAVSHRFNPGLMPWPDRHLDVGVYDGSSDCVATAFQYSYLLGQLPSQPDTSPCMDPNNGLTVYMGFSTYPGLGQEFRDAQGNRLWYAVSRNLVYDASAGQHPLINPGIVDNPTYQWLQVLDRNGSLISNRVAAVIIAPGDALDGQDRSGAADAAQFLDSFQIGAATYSNRGYATDDEDFVMGEDLKHVSNMDTTFVKPYNFNDKLIYITIDELMAALEKRVGEEVRAALKTYQDTNGYYPYAAHLGTSLSYVSDGNLLNGFLPIFQNCNYLATSATNRSLSCTQPIFDPVRSGITTVRFYLPTGTFSLSSGSCSRQSSNTRCYCTGAGSCSNASLTFTCSDTTCTATGTGATGDIRIRDGKLTFASGGCSIVTPIAQNALGCPISNTNTSRVICSATNGGAASYSNGDVPIDGYLPTWFENNQWQNYVYYQMTRPANAVLNVGGRSSEAVVVTAGSRLPTQTRPSCNLLSNYLDSAENVSANGIYDSTSTLRTTNYNDQTFVVNP